MSNISKSQGRCYSLSMSSSSGNLYCLSRFDCVWFLGKVSALVLVQFKVEMPQVVHILPQSFYGFRLNLGQSKRLCLLFIVM